MRKLCARWVPHSLEEENLCQLLETAKLHFQGYGREGDRFLRRFITLNETWVRCYQPKLKRQISGGTMILHGEKSIGKNRIHLKSCSFLFIILTVLLSLIQFLRDIVWMVYITVTFWNPLQPAVSLQRPNLLNSHPILLHDGACSHCD